jgi:hypothetical protein
VAADEQALKLKEKATDRTAGHKHRRHVRSHPRGHRRTVAGDSRAGPRGFARTGGTGMSMPDQAETGLVATLPRWTSRPGVSTVRA